MGLGIALCELPPQKVARNAQSRSSDDVESYRLPVGAWLLLLFVGTRIMATLFQAVLESYIRRLSFRNRAKLAAIVQSEAAAHSRNHNLFRSLECYFPGRH